MLLTLWGPVGGLGYLARLWQKKMGDGRGGERPTPKQQWTKDVLSSSKLLFEEMTILDLVLGAKVYGL